MLAWLGFLILGGRNMEFLKKISIKRAIMHNFWLKLMALVIAILVWLYVSGSITGGGRII